MRQIRPGQRKTLAPNASYPRGRRPPRTEALRPAVALGNRPASNAARFGGERPKARGMAPDNISRAAITPEQFTPSGAAVLEVRKN